MIISLIVDKVWIIRALNACNFFQFTKAPVIKEFLALYLLKK